MKKPNKNKQRNESTFCLLWYLKAFYSFELGTPLFKIISSQNLGQLTGM